MVNFLIARGLVLGIPFFLANAKPCGPCHPSLVSELEIPAFPINSGMLSTTFCWSHHLSAGKMGLLMGPLGTKLELYYTPSIPPIPFRNA